MAFHDNPIIDANAHRSEESVNAVKSLFTSKRGFRCRDQNPDNGVDQNVELLNDQSKATGKLFGIQIKSTNSAKIVQVNGQSYLVWQFKTSRLGYLLQYAPPGYGLVVMYVEETAKCYFDYADDIAIRADEIRGNDEWKDQETVNIHIPYANELTGESIAKVYSKLTLRFQNHDLLLAEHGPSFEIPVHNRATSVVGKFPLEKLEEGIAYLVQRNEFDKIGQLLDAYKHAEIGQFKKVCLFGMYAWLQIGDVFEAKSLLMRCKRFEREFNSFEREVYIMTKYRLSLLAGEITLEEFAKQMEIELAGFQNPTNIINVRMSVLFFKVCRLNSSAGIKEEMDEEIKSFFQEIQTLDIEEKNKHILILQYCETVSGYINSLMGELAMLIELRRNIGGALLPEVQQLVNRINDLAQVITKKLIMIAEYAEAANEKSLQTTAQYRTASHFLHVEFTLALRGLPSPLSDEIRLDYEKCLGTFIHTYNQYIKVSQYHEAYIALHSAIDIKILFRLLYNEELRDENGEQLLIRAQQMEDELGFKPYESQIEEGLRVTINERKHPGGFTMRNATDSQLELVARQIQVSIRLSPDRLNNILHELKAFRRFEQLCQNPDIELLSNAQSVVHSEQLYKHPPSYKIRSRKTGLETPSSTDIEQLLLIFQNVMRK